MLKKGILIILMFLLIYSPKIAGELDTLSVFSGIVFLYALITKNIKRLNQTITRSFTMYMVFFLIMICYSFVLYAVNGLSDSYQILRFGRCIVNSLGILGLISLYYNNFKERFIEYLIFHLWLCIILHALLMLLMFISPAVNSFVITKLIQLDSTARGFDIRISAQRIGGLTSSFDATSGVQSLGILLLPYVLNLFPKSPSKRMFILMTIPLSLFSIGISGVTGLVILGCVGFTMIVLQPRHFYKRLSKSLYILIIAVLFIGVFFKYLVGEDLSRYKDTSLGRTMYMIFQDDDLYAGAKYSATASSTFDRISNTMYFLPEKFSTLIFGLGGSGRSSDYVIKADTGPTLNIHNLGIIFFFIVYLTYIRKLIQCVKLRKQHMLLSLSLLAILLSLLIIDTKVQYLLARQSFSIMMIGLGILHYMRRDINKNNKKTGQLETYPG